MTPTATVTNSVTPTLPESSTFEVITIVAKANSTRLSDQFYFISEDSSESDGTLTRGLTSYPEWPVGATGFSIESLESGTENSQSDTLVTGINVSPPTQVGLPAGTSHVQVGPFVRRDASSFFGTTTTFEWQGALNSGEVESTTTTEVPLQFSGNSGQAGAAPQYLFDFGLGQWDSNSSTVTDTAIVEKNSDNLDIVFKVKVFDANTQTVMSSAESFGVTFSGRWHF